MQQISSKNIVKEEILQLIEKGEDISQIDELFFDFLKLSLKDVKSFFSDNYSRLLFYISSNDEISYLSKYIHSAWSHRKRALKSSNFTSKKKYIEFINAVFGKKLDFVNEEFFKSDKIKTKAIVKKSVDEDDNILINCLDIGDAKLKLSSEYEAFKLHLKPGILIYLQDFDFISYPDILLKNNYNSILVIEPSFLINVTSIASCFLNAGFNPNIYFLNSFNKVEPSKNLLIGNVVNYIFDGLVTGSDININSAIFNKPLPAFILGKKGKRYFENIYDEIDGHYENLKQILDDFQEDIVSVEPSFVSYDYGLQGRLDLLIEKGEKRKDIIELKSGSAPKNNLVFHDSHGNAIPSSIWVNHLAQTTSYNLLLDSAYEDREGVSQILYAKSIDNPFRNSVNDIKIKKELINLRNWIILTKLAIAKGNYVLFSELNPNEFGARNSYDDQKVLEFSESYNKDLDFQCYFNSMVSFFYREMLANHTGRFSNENSNTSDFDNTINNEDMISNSRIDIDKSDFDKLHIHFEFQEQPNSIRLGDFISISYSEKINGRLDKGTVKEVNKNSIKISFRNKLSNINQNNKYNISKEKSDSLSQKNLPFIYDILNSENKEYILGIKFPKDIKTIHHDFWTFNENQKEILQNAVKKDKYYLIQGPPGSGKTSIIIRNLIYYYLKNEKIIYITAYTNRAVQNIADLLSEMDLKYLRIGTKESSNDKNILGRMLENDEPNVIYNKVKNSKVVIGTFSSFMTNYEIFDLIKPEICLIDEAAQILEAQIAGFVSHFDKFIMIGDEKQLPAITLQDEKYITEKNEHLNKYEIKRWDESLFERLIRLNKKNNLDNYGLLQYQGRMSKRIMKLASKLFYNKKLKSVDLNTKYLLPRPFNEGILFIDSKTENNFKNNTDEVNVVSNAVDTLIKNKVNEKEIGIIAPFRLQCRKIRDKIDEKYPEIDVDTVERFQGSEREVIIFSFSQNRISDLKKIISPKEIDGQIVDRKLNVAITRAKSLLILVGNVEVISNYPVFYEMIKIIRKKYLILSSEEFNLEYAKTKITN